MHLVIATLRPATPGELGAIGLNALAARVESMIAGCPEALNTFKKRLLEARYVEHEFYDTIMFEPLSIASYAVTDPFPKLVRDMVPAAIVSANYSIEIDSIAEFRNDMLT
jgi:hypothetical protein